MWCVRYRFLLLFCVTVCSGEEVTTPSPTELTTLESENKTDLPQELIDEALNIDDGKYSTQSFQYWNAQKESVKGNYNDTCIDSYLDCVMNQIKPVEVCAWNEDYKNPKHGKGFWSANTYCDVLLDNCRRGYRVWRIFGYGMCKVESYGYDWRIRMPPHKPLSKDWGPRPVWP